jgi:signal transduction histidine kinase
MIVVTDQGPGLSATNGERPFERFHSGPEPTADGRRGSGLGLSIARAIVEAHGGALTLEPAPGSGARFTMRLPLAVSDAAA